MNATLTTFDRLATQIGPVPALKLCAFFAGRSVYVPKKMQHDHIIEKLIGRAAFGYLVDGYANEVLNLPAMDLLDLRRAGRLHQLIEIGASDALSAQLLGVTKRHILNIKNKLADLDDLTLEEI